MKFSSRLAPPPSVRWGAQDRRRRGRGRRTSSSSTRWRGTRDNEKGRCNATEW